MNKKRLIELHMEAAGFHGCDPALPHDWVVDIYNTTGQYAPDLAIVWCYAEPNRLLGVPLALDPEAKTFLEELPR